MCVIDPMHNLLLGTAKHVLSVWKDLGTLSRKHFDDIQLKVNSFLAPDDVGRIPSKIESGFASFTAEQWKNWTLIFSLYSLKGCVLHRDFNCWHLFVKACYLLCRRTITKEQLAEADIFLMDFCCSFEEL